MAYSLLKPILSETTLSKIKIHGYDKSIWTSDILGVVPAEVLPKALGGRAVDPDGNEWCESLVSIPLNFKLFQIFIIIISY